jgi:hypothetical protein
MNKKSLFAVSLTAFLMLSFLAIPTTPVEAWVYNDGRPSDTMFEKYGPRVDRLLVKLYPSREEEWAALEAGQIDIADALLTPTYLARYTTPPWNMTINVVSGGGGYKAMSRRYVGSTPGEQNYTGRLWEGMVNTDQTYFGGPITVDLFWSTLNMHPQGCEVGDGQNMTIRVGAVQNLTSLNPVYCLGGGGGAGGGRSLDDGNSLVSAFSSQWRGLCLVNPYNGSLVPHLAEYYEGGTYVHPVLGTCTKIKVVMTPDATWSDGTPLTMADVYFTLVELPRLLASEGYPPPSWGGPGTATDDICGFKILDPYNFEILLDVKNSTLAPGILTNIILPKHVWKPIVLADEWVFPWGKTDPNVDGCGPWRFVAINNPGLLDGYPYGHAYIANSPGSVVTTNLPGSKPVKSPLGYFRLMPTKLQSHITNPPELAWSHRIPPELAYNNITLDGPIYDSRCDRYTQNVTVLANVTPFDGPTKQILNTTKVLPPATDCIGIDIGVTVSVAPNIAFSLNKDCWWHRLTDHGFWHWPPYLNTYEFGAHVWCTVTVFAAVNVRVRIWLTVFGVHILLLYDHSWALAGGWSGTLFNAWLLVNVDIVGRWGTQCVDNHFDPARWYGTVKEDIAGSTLYDDIGWGNYTYKTELQSPDKKVDIKDVARVVAAFGSYPGLANWSGLCDITGDYKVDIKDVARVVGKFGWHG